MRLSILGTLLVSASSVAQTDLLAKHPMAEWTYWINELQPTKDVYQGPNHQLTPSQWVIERAYVVLFRLGQQCESDGYPIKLTPFDVAVTRMTGSGWAGISMQSHADNRGERIQIAVDIAYGRYGKRLCAAFNERLGRNGDLVVPLRRFTAENAPVHQYTNIVMWSDAEICAHPEEYWTFDWRNSRALPVLQQLRDQSCRAVKGR
jgi:hypothetical protein